MRFGVLCLGPKILDFSSLGSLLCVLGVLPFVWTLIFFFFPSLVPLSGDFPLVIYLFYLFILKGYSAREGWLGGLLNNFILKPLIKDLFNLPRS